MAEVKQDQGAFLRTVARENYQELVNFASEQILQGRDAKDQDGVKAAASTLVSEITSEVAAETAAETAAEAAAQMAVGLSGPRA